MQCVFGGSLIPNTFGAVLIIFLKKMRTKISIIIGLIVTLILTLGPTLGRYIIENISWYFILLLKLILGIFVCTTVYIHVDVNNPNLKFLAHFDLLVIA